MNPAGRSTFVPTRCLKRTYMTQEDAGGVAELASDSVGYTPAFEVFRRGGYEATPVVSAISTPALGQVVADADFRLCQALWQRRQQG